MFSSGDLGGSLGATGSRRKGGNAGGKSSGGNKKHMGGSMAMGVAPKMMVFANGKTPLKFG